MERRIPMLLALVLLCVPVSAHSTTYVVNPEGTGDFPTIQAAIDAAADCDVIQLAEGTFAGDGNRNVSFLGKMLTVRSRNGNPTSCVIDCEASAVDNHRAFLFVNGEGQGSTIEGVTIRNGVTSGRTAPFPDAQEKGPVCPLSGAKDWMVDRANEFLGGAVLCDEGSAPTLRNCIFIDCVSDYGGAIGLDAAYPTVIDCSFERNRALLGDGGAIGAGYQLLGQVDVRNSWFARNEANVHGGAITVGGGRTVIAGCAFIENTAWSGGAVFGCGEADGEIIGCTFLGNYATWAGAGIW